MKAKCNKKWLGGAKMASPVALAFLKVRGKFWVKKTYPSLYFKLSRAGGARPGELTCNFFLGKTQVCALYGSVFAYSNPL